MENQPPNGKKAMEQELIRGLNMANQLLEIVVDDKWKSREEGSKSVLPFAEDLVHKVLCSFTHTILLLNSNNDISHQIVVPITVKDGSSPTNCPKPMDETCKSPNVLNTKSRRRCYKRKSIAPTWENDSSIQIEDGHAWRKYGQKMTLNAKYLKNYSRCTHNKDQRCQAIKQVQRIQENPPLYRTTYYGHHTCKTSFNPEIILEPFSSSHSSMLLSFNNSLPTTQEQHFSSSLLSSTKYEPMEVIHNKHHVAQNQLSSSENLLLYEYEICFDPSTEPVQFDIVYQQFGF